MKFVQRLLTHAPALLNKAGRLNGLPFDPNTPMPPPGGRRRNWVHYGVMVPDLPAPHHVFNVLSIIGTPGATVFDNDFAVRTTPQDTAYLLSSTAAMTGDLFRAYSIEQQCDFADDGASLRFGDDLLLEGRYPTWHVRRETPDVSVTLDIEATDCVSHFAHIPGLYDHWSLLSRYAGQVEYKGERQSVSGLCTLEYAAGAGRYSLPGARFPATGKLPIKFFTYQVINLDARTQLLLVVALGPKKTPLQKAAYLRGLDGQGAVYSRAVAFTVTDYQPGTTMTPDGFPMRLPQTFTWYAEDDKGNTLLSLRCTVKGQYQYGLGAGFANWFQFEGHCQHCAVAGQGYMEYIDRQ